MQSHETKLTVRHLGVQPYPPVYAAMQQFTEQRTADTSDEIWCLQHQPVYTQGKAGKVEHIANANNIPIEQVDRGGQVTYHGPGQITLYTLVDIKRKNMGVREFVQCLESSVINTLKQYSIEAKARRDAPGVYVEQSKIAALGLRIKRGRSYHGLNFNVDMDMQPWQGINPCGLGVPVTQLADLNQGEGIGYTGVEQQLLTELVLLLSYTKIKNTKQVLPQLLDSLKTI